MTVVLCMQWLIFVAMVGAYSKVLIRFISVGTMFMLIVIYAGAVLVNFLACIWCAAAVLLTACLLTLGATRLHYQISPVSSIIPGHELFFLLSALLMPSRQDTYAECAIPGKRA